jgi:hypothetical protein
MSKFNIKSEKELANFLKILTEEAYKKSIFENEYANNYKEQFKKDSELYNLSEQPEEEPEEETLEEPEEETLEEPEEEQGSDIPAVSLEAIKNSINNLRSSKSLKDNDRLGAFYERLDDNEKLVLLSYLNTLSDILNMSGEGQDPSDPPINIQMSSGEDEADQDAEEDAAATDDQTEIEDNEEVPEEDTTPPIELAENKKSNDKAFRRKIRALML